MKENFNKSTLFDNNKIVLYDVGARGGIQPKWDNYKNDLKVYAFEPDDKIESIIFNEKENITEVNRLLFSDESNLKFYLKRHLEVSSIYHINEEYVQELDPESRDLFIIDKELTLPSTTINKLITQGCSTPDFIKIDVEGAVYEVCKGAINVLNNVIGIEAEIWFANLHINSKRFSEVELLLREYGFEFYSLQSRYGKRWNGRKYGKGKGQILYADVLFLKSPKIILKHINNFDNQDSKNDYLLKAMFIYTLYGYLDLVHELANISKNIISNHLYETIISELNKDYKKQFKIGNFKGRSRLTKLFYKLYRFFEYENDVLGQNFVSVDKDPLGNHYWE